MSLNFNKYNRLAYNLMTINGSSTSRGAQAFTFDERNRNMYVFEGGAVNRYSIDAGVDVPALDQTLAGGTALGHQGLSTEYFGNELRLWCTSSVGGRYAVRFKYVKDISIDTGEVYQLFKSGVFANNTSCTPTVSNDMRYLIAHGMKITGSKSTIRVFDLKRLLAGGPGDYTDSYLHEWETEDLYDSLNPIQGTASCGTYVYVIAGGTGFDATVNKRLHVYTMDGKLVEQNNDITVGRQDALNTSDATRYEPEGLAMMTRGGRLWLYSGYLSGKPGERRFRIYQLSALNPIDSKDLGMSAYINDFNDRIDDITRLPENTMNNVLVVDDDGVFKTQPVCKLVGIVETQDELEAQLGDTEDFAEIFNYWKRISRQGATTSDEANPAELTGWALTPTGAIESTINSASLIGFISPDKFDSYVFDVQMTSRDADDDWIGLCIAYATDPATGQTHTLTTARALNGYPFSVDRDFNLNSTFRWQIAKIYNGLTWADGVVADATNSIPQGRGGWATIPVGIRLRIEREGDIITIKTSQVNSTEFYEPATYVLDLTSDPRLEIFRGPQSFGYIAQSQRYSTWTVNERPSVSFPIVDVRNWDIYNRVAGNWIKSPSNKQDVIDRGILVPNWSHQNPTNAKFFYMDKNKDLYRV